MSIDLALRPGRWLGEAVRYAVVGLATVVVGYPVFWMLQQSLKTKFELYANVWGLPQQLFLDNYVQAWRIARMGTYIFNSVIVSVGTVVVVLVLASLAGYAFARMRFAGRQVLFYAFVFTLIVPLQVTIIPLYAVVSGLGLTNTYFALILPYAAGGLPLSIFLLRAFFQSVPREIEEAARIDGCSELAAFWRVVLPISGPGLATVTILQFLAAWNEFLLALIFIRNPALRTIPLGLQAFFFEYSVEWGYLFAALSMATVPVIIVYVLMQRHFITGLTAGAVKG
jgi:raffinose/stachyose/melibiose transport system permease protein